MRGYLLKDHNPDGVIAGGLVLGSEISAGHSNAQVARILGLNE